MRCVPGPWPARCTQIISVCTVVLQADRDVLRVVRGTARAARHVWHRGAHPDVCG